MEGDHLTRAMMLATLPSRSISPEDVDKGKWKRMSEKKVQNGSSDRVQPVEEEHK